MEPTANTVPPLTSRQILHSLFEKAPSFVAILEGPQHHYTFSNAANNELLGRGDVVGRSVREVLPELIDQGFGSILDRVYSTGEAFTAHDMPIRVTGSAEGGWDERYVSFVYQPILDSEGTTVGIFIDGHDVTDRHRADKRAQTLQAELVHVSRANAMGTMASTLAHELNQPLSVIGNYIAALRRIAEREGTLPEVSEALAGIETAAARAAEIIRLLRAMTRHGRMEGGPLSLEEPTRDAVQLARLAHPKVVVRYEIEPLLTAKVDKVQYQQVLLNLIQNACEAVGDRYCEILIRGWATENEINVCVTDNGPGIAPDVLPTIFGALTTTKVHGMGVGLSICRTIVEANGGHITARNLPQRGAEACFTLPKA